MRAELRQMVSQGRGGAIVNIGSIAGLTGLAGDPAYVASKHGVTGLTRQAAVAYAPNGIRVNSVNMAATDTPMTEHAFEFVRASQAEGGSQPMIGGTEFPRSTTLQRKTGSCGKDPHSGLSLMRVPPPDT